MKVKLINVGPGVCVNLTLPNGDPFIMAEGAEMDTTDSIGAWLVEHYGEYVTTVSTAAVAKEPRPKE